MFFRFSSIIFTLTSFCNLYVTRHVYQYLVYQNEDKTTLTLSLTIKLFFLSNLIFKKVVPIKHEKEILKTNLSLNQRCATNLKQSYYHLQLLIPFILSKTWRKLLGQFINSGQVKKSSVYFSNKCCLLKSFLYLLKIVNHDNPKQTFTCSKETIEQQKKVWNMFKVTYTDIRMTSL